MEGFLTRQYRVFSTILMFAIVGLAFYVGMLEGKQSQGSAVVLSCSDEVLASLKIPVEALSQQAKPSVTSAAPTDLTASTTSLTPQGKFAGSKNGTKYYTPGCSGLNRIKPENIIWFQSAEDATLQGYTAAAC